MTTSHNPWPARILALRRALSGTPEPLSLRKTAEALGCNYKSVDRWSHGVTAPTKAWQLIIAQAERKHGITP